ncbi:23S rRNA (uracil(1939)-C(5))-methyltransferase RlmD [Muriicola jejuensis]|uniref:23S rRNA (Uracil(1939)-C(5))-methyltransferase RlmD n=1 Tax=Muriicola jejuensis TaxID=504488 RepID=A0A6P0UEI4_9FLAO|nr:23S rRNA (uracil(1939)-C(5))-methyltransferase RlmD [Muriicola jejuensis]NER11032.1 23S rRNA (uracil(1939)-C(5))-methyltransferase RlmD [Muriicola jejuensis]
MRKKNTRQLFEKIDVLDAGAKGMAVAKTPDGRIIFLNNAVPGDVVTVQTTKKRKAYFEGVATHFHKLSPRRTEPKCKHFEVCGGCKWQHMNYESQLFYKQREVENNLRRIGHLDFPEILPILGSEKQFFYRNKMEFSFSDSRWLYPHELRDQAPIKDKNALGLHIPGMWDKVLDLEECHLQPDPSNAIRLEIRRFATENELTFFNPRTQEGLLRTLMIRTSSTGEVMVLIQFAREDGKSRSLLLDHIAQAFPEITSLLYVINTKKNDTLYDQEIHCYKGRDHIWEAMEDLTFRIDAKSFYQTNSEQAHSLYKVVRDFAGLTGGELVYDLYTGTGTIAQFVSGKARKVIGIEIVPEAVAAARINAENNGIHNTEFVTGDMKKVLDPSIVREHGVPDVLITDPPREGMHKEVVDQILAMSPEKIVYVSCNSATQARDLGLMKEQYEILKVQPVDMFPQTHHVENVVLLKKRIA